MSSRFEFRGSLDQTPLPEVLETINRYRVPGVIEVSRDEWTRKIFILEGEIIFASSNNLSDSLGDFLLRAGRLSQEQYDQSVEILKQTGKRQGTVLVEMGVLTPKTLFTSVVDQVRAIVWDTFNWSEGAVTFAVGRFKDDELIKLAVPTRQAILRGILGMNDARRLVSRLGGATVVYTGGPDAADLEELQLQPEEANFLRDVSGQRAVKELVESGPRSAADNARLLYAFHCLRLIRRKEAIRVYSRSGRPPGPDPA